MKARGITICLLALMGAGAATLQGASGEALPYARLFDAGVRLADPVPAVDLERRGGWSALAEGETSRSFQGDAVLMNDRAAVVLHRGGTAVLYSATAEGMARRLTVSPWLTAERPAELRSVAVLENAAAACAVEATFSEAGAGECHLAFRITAGEPTVEVRAGKGTRAVAVGSPARRMVVPNFLADDFVLDMGPAGPAGAGLPVDGCLILPLGEGNAIAMCVRKPSERAVEAFAPPGGDRDGTTFAVFECAESERIWVAVLEGSGIWHAQPARADGETALDWQPPFPAKWRMDFAQPDGTCQSQPLLGLAEAEEGEGAAPADGWSCRLDVDRVLVRPAAGGGRGPALALVYPADRSRLTPLTVLCPVDVLRSALGVGPCQYILDAEGLGSAAGATPDEVTRWVEKLFERKRAVREADAVKAALDQTVAHVERLRERIELYRGLSREVRLLCDNAAHSGPAADVAVRLRQVAALVEDAAKTSAEALKGAGGVKRIADELAACAAAGAAESEARPLCAALRSAGAAQDRALSACRMGARRLQAESRTAESDPGAAELKRQVRELLERPLGSG